MKINTMLKRRTKAEEEESSCIPELMSTDFLITIPKKAETNQTNTHHIQGINTRADSNPADLDQDTNRQLQDLSHLSADKQTFEWWYHDHGTAKNLREWNLNQKTNTAALPFSVQGTGMYHAFNPALKLISYNPPKKLQKL